MLAFEGDILANQCNTNHQWR